MENTSSNRLSWIPILLIIFNFTANLSNDIYLPSLPRLIQVFHTSANTVQLTMTIWFAGVAIPQLFFGPLTEKYGRRPILMWGGVCFVISSLLCCVASSIHMLLIARFFQGVGVCSLNVTSFSILSDLYAYKQRIKIMTQISICGTLAPLIGPIIGGYILTLLGWRENFMLIFSLGLISLIGLKLSLPETNLELNTEATKLKRVAANYLSLLKTHGFLTHLIPYCLMLGGLVVYLTAAPFIIINKLHVSAAHFGYTQLPIFGTYILGAYCLGRVQDDLHIKQLIKVGIGLVLAASACMLLAGLIFGNHLISFILPMTIYTFGFSLCSSSLTAEVMDVGANSKGLTAAFLGFGMAVACVIGNALLSLVYNGTIYSVAGLLFVMTLIAGSFFLYQQLRRHAI